MLEPCVRNAKPTRFNHCGLKSHPNMFATSPTLANQHKASNAVTLCMHSANYNVRFLSGSSEDAAGSG